MSNQVILVLDRDTAGEVASCVDALDWSGEPEALAVQGQRAILAALEVDPETRIEHIARALENETPGRKPDIYNRLAKAALSALCENPGQERGLVDEASPTPVGHDEPGVETGSGEDENCA